MPVIRVRKHSFSAMSKLASREQGGLSSIMQGILVREARRSLYGASVSALTDNTTGVANLPSIVNCPVPFVNALSGSNGAQAAAFSASLGKIKNATAVLVAAFNAVAGRFTLPRITYSEGSVATPYTLPALDKTSTTAGVATAVDFQTAVAAMNAVELNLDILSYAFNELLLVLGQKKLKENLGQSAKSFAVLSLLPAVQNAAASQQSMLATDVNTWLTAVANNFATLAAAWNMQIIGDAITLTDSTGGTAAGALAANAVPAAAAGAATTSAPKAGFDTQLGVIKNSVASLAKAYNEMAYTQGGALPVLVDASGGTASTTLAAISASLTAVDGSSGTNAVDQASAITQMNNVDNDLSTLGSFVTKLANALDVQPLGADALAGNVGTTLTAIGSTAAGVGGTGNVTILNAAANTWLAGTKNNISSIAAVLNACAAELGLYPMAVIAG